MGESQEYALKRLDQWLVDRYNRYYTSEVERGVQSLLKSFVENGSVENLTNNST